MVEARQHANGLDDREQRQGLSERKAVALQYAGSSSGKLRDRLREEARLADARFAEHQGRTVLRAVQHPHQPAKLIETPN